MSTSLVDEGDEDESIRKMSSTNSLSSSSSSLLSSSASSATMMMPIMGTSRCSTTTTTQSSIDKLRTIKPFDEKQLLSLYRNSLLDDNRRLVHEFVHRYAYVDRNVRDYRDNVIHRYERSLERYADASQAINRLISSIDELEQKCWTAEVCRTTKSERCADGQLVEAVHEFTMQRFDAESAAELEQRFYFVLKERLTNEHIVAHYQLKFYQLKFELMLCEMLELVQRYAASLHSLPPLSQSTKADEPESPSPPPQHRFAKEHLQDWIAALFVYLRKTEHVNERLNVQCHESLILLAQEYQKIATLEDRLELLNHALRCPSGSSAALAPLIVCPDPTPFRVSDYARGKRLVDFSVTVIATILSPIIDREKFLNLPSSSAKTALPIIDSHRSKQNSTQTSEPWLLIDTDFEDDLVHISPYDITEFDLINYLDRVPFEQILNFMSMTADDIGSRNIDEPEADLTEHDRNHFVISAETMMMKQFAFHSRLIGILRDALQNFNYLRYKELTLRIAKMVKQIVRQISNQWRWCKESARAFVTQDQALLVRLQVEFDSFMLRSIAAMLSTKRRGVWPLLAKIEFIGISEPMLWHILWVVYNNGADDNLELSSGLCPYMSANFWKDKLLDYRQWKAIFFERLSHFSPEEAAGLIRFLQNMAVSRDEKHDANFLHEIIRRVAEICLLKKCYPDCRADTATSNVSGFADSTGEENCEKNIPTIDSGFSIRNQQFYIDVGKSCFTRLLNRFKSLITVWLQFIAEQAESNILPDAALSIAESLNIDGYIPDAKFFHLIYLWLADAPLGGVRNRIARIAASKLDWNRILVQNTRCLLLAEDVQRRHALKLYDAVIAQVIAAATTTSDQTSSEKVDFADSTKRFSAAAAAPLPQSAKQRQAALSLIHRLTIDRESIGGNNLLRLARSTELKDYIAWTWSSLLTIRIHPLDFIPDQSTWDDVIFGLSSSSSSSSSASSPPPRVNFKHRIFQHLPKINYDNEMTAIGEAINASSDGDQNGFAGYIALMMSDLIVKNDPSQYIDLMAATLARPNSITHHLPLLNVLLHFVPLYLHQHESLRSNSKFIGIIFDLVGTGRHTDELCSVILAQLKHFDEPRNAAQLAIAWTDILFEALHQALSNAARTSSSWFPSFGGGGTQTCTLATGDHLEIALQQLTIIFDRLAQEIILISGSSSGRTSSTASANNLFERYISYLVTKPYTKLCTTSAVCAKLISIIESPTAGSAQSSALTTTLAINDPSVTTAATSSGSWSVLNLITWYSSTNDGDDDRMMSIHYLADKAILKSTWCTPLHLLLRQAINRKIAKDQQKQKNFITKKLQRSDAMSDRAAEQSNANLPFYLAYLVIEADMRKCCPVWNQLICAINDREITRGEVATIDFEAELKNVCRLFDLSEPIPFALLPINSLIVWLLNGLPSSSPHPMLPLLWKNFFQLYFSNGSGSGSSSIGLKFISAAVLNRLSNRLTQAFDHHNRVWLSLNNRNAESQSQPQPVSLIERSQSDQISWMLFEDRLVKLYRAYRLWLHDRRLHHSFVNLDDDDAEYSRPEFQANILKYIFTIGGGGDCHRTDSPSGDLTRSVSPNSDYDNRFTTNFFYLNYIDNTKLEREIAYYEDFWYDLIKSPKRRNVVDSQNALAQKEKANLSSLRSKSKQKTTTTTKKKMLPQSDAFASVKPEEVKRKIGGQYKPIIDYFAELTSSLNANLLFDDNVYMIEDPARVPLDIDRPPDSSTIIVIVHQLIDTAVEEARFVELQLQKYFDLNREFQADLLPKLYQNIRRDIVRKVACDRDEFDASGCAHPATIKFEFVESILDTSAKQKYDRNRAEFATVIRALIDEIPGQRVVASVYFLQKVLHYLLRYFDGDRETEANQVQIRLLLKSMTSWMALLNSVQSSKHFVVTQVLDQLLDMLHTLIGRSYTDEINCFLLETALQRNMCSTMIQQLAPALSPGACTRSQTFIEMYQLIGSNMCDAYAHDEQQQHTVFVLLSKFDVVTWFQSDAVTDQQRAQFLQCLYECLRIFGVTPRHEFLVTFDLYRKHLQDIILYRFPLFMENILRFMLASMNESSVAPSLWNSIMHTFGFYTKSLSFGASSSTKITNGKDGGANVNPQFVTQSTLLDFDYIAFDLDLREYTRRQTIVNSHELFELCGIVIDFHRQCHRELNNEFLDHFKTYASKYLQFVSFISYCWISTNSTATTCPDDLSVVWQPFIDLWSCWILPKRTTKFISFEHLQFTWRLFIGATQFMIDSFAATTTPATTYFLSNIWQIFLKFITENTANAPRMIEQRDISMFEDCLLTLTGWSTFDPTIADIELMYEAVIQNRFSVERFIAYVIARIDWRDTLSRFEGRITAIQLANIVENLSYVLIALAEQPFIADIDLDTIPFALLEPAKVRRITLMLLPMMKQKMQCGLNTDGGDRPQITVFFVDKTTATPAEKVSGKSSTSDPAPIGGEATLLSLLRAICDVQRNRNDAPAANTSAFSLDRPSSENDQDLRSATWFIAKCVYYTSCISALIAEFCNVIPAVSGSRRRRDDDDDRLASMQQIRPLLQCWFKNIHSSLLAIDSHDRAPQFDAILAAINSVIDETVRRRLCTIFVSSISYSLPPESATSTCTLLADLIIAINRTVQSAPSLVYMLECFIEIYLDLSGDIPFLVDNLNVRFTTSGRSSPSLAPISGSARSGESAPSSPQSSSSLASSSIATEAIRAQSCLLLLVHLYNRLAKSTVPEQCTRRYAHSLIEQCATFRPSPENHDEPKIILYFFKIFTLLAGRESDSGLSECDPIVNALAESANRFDKTMIVSITANRSVPTGATGSGAEDDECNFLNDIELHSSIQTLQQVCKTLHESVADLSNRGWIFFRTQKHSSNWCLFLFESMVMHGVCTLMEQFYPDAILSLYDSLFLPSSPQPAQTTALSAINEQQNLHRSSSSTDSLHSSSGSSSARSSSANLTSAISTSANSSSSAAATTSMLYSDSIRAKIRNELQDLLKSSHGRLMKTWKRDKSFADIWPHIDDFAAIFERQLELLRKAVAAAAAGASSFATDFDSMAISNFTSSSSSSSSLSSLSAGGNRRNAVTGKRQIVRQHFTLLQRKRFELLRSSIGTFYSDKKFIKAFLL